MVYVASKTERSEINFLKSEKFVSFTTQVDKSTKGVKDGVVPAGTILPANDATAQGVTINPIDVTKGPQPVGLIVEGHILSERLPVAPTAAAITAMKQINFYDGAGNVIKGGAN